MANPTSPVSRREVYLNQINHTLNCVSVCAVFAIHFLLGTAVLLVKEECYYENKNLLVFVALYNTLFFFVIFWSVHEHSKPGPLQMATTIDLVSIVFDAIVASHYCEMCLWLLVINIAFRPFTAIVLLRKSYERKRRFNLQANEPVSLAAAIKNLLYNQSGETQSDNLESGGKDVKSDARLPNVFTTFPPPTITMAAANQS